MKIKRSLLMLFALVLMTFPAFAEDYHFFSSPELNQLWGPSPGTVRNSPAAAFGNPAYNGTQQKGYLEAEILYASEGFDFGDLKNLGGFLSMNRTSLGMLYSSLGEGRDQLDIKFGLGFGNRGFSFGLSNGSIAAPKGGKNQFFNNYRLSTIARPLPYLSLGMDLGGTYNGDWFDLGGELGVRPLGTSLLSLFATYSWVFHDGETEPYWSAGIELRPVSGLAIRSAYYNDKRLSLGVSVSWESLSLSGAALMPRDFSSVSTAVYGLSHGGVRSEQSLPLPPPSYRVHYLELNLTGLPGPRSFGFGRSAMLNLYQVIEKAAADPEVAGIILNTSGFSANRTEKWELRNALENFKKSGKGIVAFIDNADFDTYLLASVADRIVMDSEGMLTMYGYAYSRTYLMHTLEKLGIGVTEMRYLSHKSAAEMFTRDSLSEADREQYGAYLDDIFNYAKAVLMEARSWTEEDFNRILNQEYLYSARSARELGLVDAVGRGEAVLRLVQERAGRDKLGLRVYGDSSTRLMDVEGFSRPYTFRVQPQDIWGEPPHIAVIYASGQTDMDRGMDARSLARTIRNTARNPRVKAMVIRVESSGGSAVAADYMAEAIRDAKTRIPVVVSMGPVAGSGGYWASMYADRIVASPYTLTGSIGIIGSWLYDQGLNEKLGVSVDTLGRGDHADMRSGFILPKRDLDEGEQERYRLYMMDLYGEFTAKVSASRGIPQADVERLAQGRIYSGISAQALNLTDRIGGLDDAIRIARDLAGIAAGREIVYDEYPVRRFFSPMLNRIMGGLPGSGSDSGMDNPLTEEIRYRVSNNGKAMPMMSVRFMEP